MLHPHQEDLNKDSEEEDQDAVEFELQAKAEEEALARGSLSCLTVPKKVDTATKFNPDSEDDDDFLADPPAKDDDDVHSLASHLSLDAVE